MKQKGFIKHLRKHNCVLDVEGAKHSKFINIETGKVATVPRHKEINDFLVIKICKELDIPNP